MKSIGQENIKELKWLNSEVGEKKKENGKQIDQKSNPLSKLQLYREPYFILIILTLVIGLELILFIFGSKFIA